MKFENESRSNLHSYFSTGVISGLAGGDLGPSVTEEIERVYYTEGLHFCINGHDCSWVRVHKIDIIRLLNIGLLIKT